MEDGKQQYQRSVDEGLAQQEHLISESEVMRRADEEAHRLVENAHSESSRLRRECDEYVDSKLAEFEDALSSVLRTVASDRSALRRGAGVAGAAGESGGRRNERQEQTGHYEPRRYPRRSRGEQRDQY